MSLQANYLTFLAALAISAMMLISAKELKMRVSFYGAPDNDPPNSCEIAYSSVRGRDCAGGVGTYEDPVSLAAPKNTKLKKGDIVYVQHIKRYCIYEDWCAEGCIQNQIDIWVGGTKGTKKQTLACEDELDRRSGAVVITNPSKNLEVDTTPLFDSSTKKCYPSNS